MIFVTVGTHEQPFNRLVEALDELVETGKIKEEVIIQTGYSTYTPKHCRSEAFFPYQQMFEMVEQAHIVITHGGPSSFIMPLQIGKVPIVVPRQQSFGEHVNDHQKSFCEELYNRRKNIILVEDIRTLGDVINDYDKIAGEVGEKFGENNATFCESLEIIVKEMMG